MAVMVITAAITYLISNRQKKLNDVIPRGVSCHPPNWSGLYSYQNHKNVNIFSFIMFDGRTHKASKRWMLPEGPYRFILHLVTRGNIFVIGSSRMFWSFSTSARTFGPYELNSFPRNTSVKYILPSTTTKFANSAKTYCAAHATWCPLDFTKYRARAVVCEHFSYLSSGNRFIYKKERWKEKTR